MTWPLLIAVLVAVLLVYGAVFAFMHRLKKGRFRVLQEDRHSFLFRSDFGEFTIDGKGRCLRIAARGKQESVPFDRIFRLEYSYEPAGALVEAIWGEVLPSAAGGLLEGANHWYRLSAVLLGGRIVPLYLVGQYEPEASDWEWLYELQLGVFRSLQLVKNVDQVSLQVVKRVQQAFADCGKPLSLV